ncbi:hypothetical protein ACRE_040910 [Hapsidospora chrysogenum ATCC 11550]|uniref:Uncharacterized protein n=1 Tax=Hapsidospora chrysogenum (strain ATCC 11550 / CBS 779.69 / DSM 880 / IAM 14645 / JCM 23072 / IMI 49137) TaxID=857340 RepID=A0A086T6X8_HAPC1|nr:hypothetical protein ACRE_040910 [Hapsidospora chrysogenum ATCC 11550]
MAVSAAAAAHCVSPDSFNHSLSITNFDKNRCFNRTTSYEPWGATNYWTCHEYWFTNVPNITAIPPVAVEDDLATWLYQSESELNSSLPAAKPLLIDCPMPVCVFGISGPYADLQRWLIYANLGFALLASAAPILRGVAQIYLATTSISATVHFWVMYSLQDKGFVDMDVLPSLLYGISGIVASQLWLLLRRQHVKRTRDFFFYVLLPYSMVFLYFPIASALLIHYSQNPAGARKAGTTTSYSFGNFLGHLPSALQQAAKEDVERQPVRLSAASWFMALQRIEIRAEFGIFSIKPIEPAYQTTQERNLTAIRAGRTSPEPVWLCTCSRESRAKFEAAYAALLAPVIEESLIVEYGVLDDVEVYGHFEDGDWSRVLVRIPQLCDVVRANSDVLHEEMEREMERMMEEIVKEECGEMEKLDVTVVDNVYLVDAEALQEELVKVLWLNCHGECVWHNKIAADDIHEFMGYQLAAWSVTDILQLAESREKGARLQI